MRAINVQTSNYSGLSTHDWQEDGVYYSERVLDVSIRIELNNQETTAMLAAHDGNESGNEELQRLLPGDIHITSARRGQVTLVVTSIYRQANCLHGAKQTAEHVLALLQVAFRGWGC